MTDKALQIVDTTTGEIFESDAIVPYTGASMLKLAEGEQEKLLATFEESDIKIRPDGLIYLPQVFFRERLNQVFGVGQWALKPVHTGAKDNFYFYNGQLYVRGYFVAEATGEQTYWENNAQQSYASAYEAAKSDCIVRCCKDMGIAAECWKPQYQEKWIAENGCKMWCRDTKKNKNVVIWKHKDAPPLGYPYEEISVMKDSPNQPKKKPSTQPPKAEPQDDPRNEPPQIGDDDDEIDWSSPKLRLIKDAIKAFTSLATLNEWSKSNTINFQTVSPAWQEEIRKAFDKQRESLKEK